MAKVLIKSEKSTSFEVFFSKEYFFGQIAHVEPHVVLFIMVLAHVLFDLEQHMSEALKKYDE